MALILDEQEFSTSCYTLRCSEQRSVDDAASHTQRMQVGVQCPGAMEALQYFFSYARKDAAFVLRLAQELREVGINLWLDQLDILGGQRWDRAVEEALQTCLGMIAVLSPDALASHNVMDEVSYALDERKIIIPILLQSDRTILTRLLILSHSVCFTARTKTLHERRRAQVRAPGTDWVYTPAWWGRLRGSAARRHETVYLAPALPHWPPCGRSWT